jgi:hypothetical protein
MVTSKYNFRDRTKEVRNAVEQKQHQRAEVRKRKVEEAKTLRAAKKAKTAMETTMQEEETTQKPEPAVKIPGLTLQKGEKVELGDITIPDPKPASMPVEDNMNDAVKAFDTSIKTYLDSIDTCRATAPQSNVLKRELRGTEEAQRNMQIAFEQALAKQESAAKALCAATDELALGKYFLNVYSKAKVPLGEPMKFDLSKTLHQSSWETDSPIDDFPWIKVDLVAGGGESNGFTLVVSPSSTPYLVPDGSSAEPVKGYSRTFDHRIEACPHPSMCPLCQHRSHESAPTLRLVSVSSDESSKAAPEPMRSPASTVSPPSEQEEIKQKIDPSLPPTEIKSGSEKATETLQKPPSDMAHMSEAVPPILSPATETSTRIVEVSLFRANGSQIGGGPHKLESHGCENFYDFKQRIMEEFQDAISESGLPFNRIIYDQFAVFSGDDVVLETDDENTSQDAWDEFASLLEGARGKKDSKKVLGQVEVIFQ